MDLIITMLKTLANVYIVVSLIFTTYFLIAFAKNYFQEVKSERNDMASKLSIALDKLKPILVEEVDGRVMMYDATTNEFLCQANTLDELWAEAERLYPNTLMYRPSELVDKKQRV